MTGITRIGIPKGIAFAEVARAMAGLGLVHDGHIHPDGVSRWVPAPKGWSALHNARCEVAECGQAAAVRVGKLHFCCTHYLSTVRAKGLL